MDWRLGKVTAEVAESLFAALGLCGGLLAWLWRTASNVTRAHVQLGIAESDIANLKKETRELHDKSIRQQSMLEAILAKLSKIDLVPQLVSNVESMRETVDRMDRLVVPRQEIEQIHMGLTERMRLLEDRSK
jgi:hypothetical protein